MKLMQKVGVLFWGLEKVASLTHRLIVYKKVLNRVGVKALFLGLENSGVTIAPFASSQKRYETAWEWRHYLWEEKRGILRGTDDRFEKELANGLGASAIFEAPAK